jgi:hypothetical protein
VRRAIVLAILVLQLQAVPAAASCAGPVPIPQAMQEASAVFVGTVVGLENMRRWATVEISDTWKGPVEDVVEVRAGPKDPPGPISAASSVDRYYRRGVEYLFVVYKGRGGVYRDSNCSATTRYKPQLQRFRPASATSASPSPVETELPPAANEDEEDGASSTWWWIAGGVALVLGVAVGIVTRRSGT